MVATIVNSVFGLTFTLYSIAPLVWVFMGWVSAETLKLSREAEREIITIGNRRCDFNSANVKILFYNHTGKVSGAERALLTIRTRLDGERFQPLLVCPADGPLKGIVEDVNVRTIVSEPLKARFTWRPER